MLEAVRRRFPALAITLLFVSAGTVARAGDAPKDDAPVVAADGDKPLDADKPADDKPLDADKPADGDKPLDADKPAADGEKPTGDAEKPADEEKAPAKETGPAPGTLAPVKHPAKPAEEAKEGGDEEKPVEKAVVPLAKRKGVAVLTYATVNHEVAQSNCDKITDMFRDEINKAGEFRLVDLGGSSASAEKPGVAEMATAKTGMAGAMEQLGKVKPLLERKKMKPAAEALDKGIAAFLKNFQAADDFKPLSDAFVRLAVIRFLHGDEDGTTRALDDLVRLDPTRTLTASDIKSLTGSDSAGELATRHAAERKSIFAKKRGDIRIETEPAGAKIAIDGVAVGETPLLAKSLLPGDHYLVITKEGVGAFWKQVSVKSGVVAVTAALTAEATGPLTSVAKNLNRNTVDSETKADLKSLAASVKADYVVFGGVRPDGDTLIVKSFVLRTKDGFIGELAAASVDPSLLGAGIEIVKVANDLSAKIQTNEFNSGSGLTAIFDGVAPAQEAAIAVTEVVITPPNAGAKASSEEGGPDDSATPTTHHGHGPVVSHTDEPTRKPASKPAVEETPKTDSGPKKTALEQLEEQRKRRSSGSRARKSDDDSDKAPAAEEETGSNDSGEPKQIDLKPHNKSSDSDAAPTLSPEQLQALERARETDNHSSSPVGKIVLWSSVGAVGLAAIIVGGYFLFKPSSPGGATAAATWTP